jgi:hypothetical protein
MTNAVNIAQSGSNNVTFRNKIINGGMVIDQRNAGTSITTNAYCPDRWLPEQTTDGVRTAQQVSDAPTGFVKSLKLTTTTADSSLAATQYSIVRQGIEGYNTADLMWGTALATTITISFWVKSSLTGTFGGVVGNNAFNRSYPFTYSINSANTWEQKSITIAGDQSGTWETTNSAGIQLYFGLGAGTTYSGTAGAWTSSGLVTATGTVNLMGTLNATWQITGVQLEAGTTASPFEYRQYGTELALCHRYYWRVTPGTTSAYYPSVYSAYAGNSMFGSISIPTPMRAAPSFTYSALSDWNTTAATYNGGNNASWTMNTSGVQQASLTIISSNGGYSTNGVIYVYPNNTTAWFAFSAEL